MSANNVRNEPLDADVVENAREVVNVAGAGASFVNDNIHPVLDALVELSDCEGMELNAIRRRMSLVRDLAKLGRQLAEEAAGHMEWLGDEATKKLSLVQNSGK